MKGFLQNILQEITKKIIIGTSDAWSMRWFSNPPSNPAYYIEDCHIFGKDSRHKVHRDENFVLFWEKSQLCFSTPKCTPPDVNESSFWTKIWAYKQKLWDIYAPYIVS